MNWCILDYHIYIYICMYVFMYIILIKIFINVLLTFHKLIINNILQKVRVIEYFKLIKCWNCSLAWYTSFNLEPSRVMLSSIITMCFFLLNRTYTNRYKNTFMPLFHIKCQEIESFLTNIFKIIYIYIYIFDSKI